MSAVDRIGPMLVRGLLDALRPALQPGAPERTCAIARDVAQVLGLGGLDAVLIELQQLRGVARPADLAHVTARLARLAGQAEREETHDCFLAADAELAALARALRETEWGDGGDDAVAVYPASDVLADLPLEPNEDLPLARLSAQAAASLRAALEWIGADEALLVQAAVRDSALTLTCPAAHAGGVGPAAAVLASIEGSIGPEPDGRWTLRVPLYVERPSFLLLRIGHIPVALPWHSVARLRMLSPADWPHQPEAVLGPLTTLQPGADERPGALVALGLTRAWLVADRIVWRIAATPEEVHERGPLAASTRVVSVDNGERYWVLEPAWLLRGVAPTPVAPPAPRHRHGAAAHVPGSPPVTVAAAPDPGAVIDVTPEAGARSAAAPGATVEAPAGRAPGGNPLADVVERAIAQLRLEREASAPAPPAPPSRELPRQSASASGPPAPPSREVPRQSASASGPPAPPSREVPRPPASGIGPAPSPSRGLPRPAPAAPPSVQHSRLMVLRSEDVVQLEAAARALSPAPSVVRPLQTAEPSPSSTAPAEAGILPGRRALVADDSLVARIFLARLLERRGFVVELVGDGERMWHELSHGPWALVCADVTMPDSHGRAHLERLLDFRAACREPFTLIALTRDADEEHVATLAGATLHLRKPFDPVALDAMLDR